MDLLNKKFYNNKKLIFLFKIYIYLKYFLKTIYWNIIIIFKIVIIFWFTLRIKSTAFTQFDPTYTYNTSTNSTHAKRINPDYVITDQIFMVGIFTLGKRFNLLLRIMKSTQRTLFDIQYSREAFGTRHDSSAWCAAQEERHTRTPSSLNHNIQPNCVRSLIYKGIWVVLGFYWPFCRALSSIQHTVVGNYWKCYVISGMHLKRMN